MNKLYFSLILSLFFCANSHAENRNISAFFNHFQGAEYTDPYRQVARKGHNLEEQIIKNILFAKKSIHLAVQEIRLPGIALALVKKANEGVDVRIVLENSYNHSFNTSPLVYSDVMSEHEATRSADLKAFIDMNNDGHISKKELAQRDAVYILKKSKIKIIDDTFDLSDGSGLMHHKFMVVDGARVLVTSANFTLSDIHGDFTNNRSLGNANSLIVVKSRVLASSFTTEFLLMWGGRNGYGQNRFGLGKPHRAVESTKVLGDIVSVQFSPISKTQPWKNSVNGLIAREITNSKRSTKAALFVFSDQKIADALEQKANDSAEYEVGMLVERKFAYRSYSELLDIWGISMRNENCEFEAGNNPWRHPVYDVGVPNLSSGDMLHHKFAVIDNSTVIVGSQNWSDSANHLNDENILVIKNKNIAKMFTQEFNRLYRSSNKGPPRSLIMRASEQNRRCVLSDIN